MPKTPRKSSLGASRRGPLKAHIPYRGDNPEVGKKTGIAVQHVERQSDGFEPFDQILQQADGRTPPRRKGRSKSYSVAAHQDDDDDDDEDEDEYGEASMQMASPVLNLTNARPPISPAKSHRSSTRPVARTSDIDFDKIPSPRRPGSSKAKSSPGEPHQDDDQDDYPDQLDDYAPHESPAPQSSPRRKSFQPRYDEPDQDMMEDEIAQELENVEPEFESDEEEVEEEPPQPVAKKAKPETKNPSKTKNPPKTQSQSRTKKENREVRPGVRRSQREHYKPLEFWRGERLVYGRIPDSGPILVPQIKEIIRIPREVPVPLGAKKNKRRRGGTRPRSGSPRQRSRSSALDVMEDDIPPALPVVDPEEGWDDKTEAKCTVVHFTTKEEVERRIAWTAKMVQPRQAANHTWSFDKIFGDDDFIAAGQLIIPPKGRKPSKAAKDNTYVFYVIEGAVNFKIHDTSMILATGGMFMVPRGNTYFIENICERDAKLFFTQARKVEMNKEELIARAEVATELQRRRSSNVRSSSAGGTAKSKPTTNGRAATIGA